MLALALSALLSSSNVLCDFERLPKPVYRQLKLEVAKCLGDKKCGKENLRLSPKMRQELWKVCVLLNDA